MTHSCWNGGPILHDELQVWVDSGEAERFAEEFATLRGEGLVPLLVEDRILGLIAIGEKLSGYPFFTHDLELLATLGHQAGVALKRAQLHEEVAWMKEYSESILRHMESGLVVASNDGAITVLNEAAARMLGVAATGMVGSAAMRLIPCGLGRPLLDTLKGKTICTNHEAILTPASGGALPIV